MMRISLLIVFIVCIPLGLDRCRADEFRELAEYHGASFANAELWKKYDILVKETKFRRGPKSYVDIPDVRLVGIGRYPQLFDPTRGFDAMVKMRSTGVRPPPQDGYRIVIANVNDAIQTTQYIPGGTTSTDRRDPKSLLVTQSVQRGKDFLISEQSYSWADKGGVFVPTEILGEKNIRQTETENSNYYTTVSIHWCSFNEPIDRKLFDPQFYDSLSQLMKCIDPELLGADELK